MTFPRVSITAESVRIDFSDGEPVQRVPFTCVIDKDTFGTLIGVEILDFRDAIGIVPPPSPADGDVRWGYDGDIGAFYLHLAPGTAPIQENFKGTAGIASNRALTNLDIRLSPIT